DRAAQDRERQGQHDTVGIHVDRAVADAKRKPVTAVARPPNRRERVAEMNLPAKRRRDARGNLVVAAAHMIFFVGRTEEPQLTGSDITKKIKQIERALFARLRAILDIVG